MKELIKAINKYRSMIAINLDDEQAGAIANTPVALKLDYEIMKAEKKLKNNNLTINVKCEMPDIKQSVNEIADKFVKGIKADKHPGFKNCLLTDNDYDLCKNKETGEIYFFKFEQDADPVRFRLISLSNIFDEQYVTLEHFRKNYRTISYDTTRIHC